MLLTVERDSEKRREGRDGFRNCLGRKGASKEGRKRLKTFLIFCIFLVSLCVGNNLRFLCFLSSSPHLFLFVKQKSELISTHGWRSPMGNVLKRPLFHT